MAVVVVDDEGKQLVDLEASFGRRFKVSWEADGATRNQWPREAWPWLMEIRGRHGLIHPYGGELLCAVSNTGHTGAKLRRLPFVLDARGDQETVIRFHVDHVKDVFGIIRPYRRRRVSEETRKRLRELSTLHGFGARRISEGQSTALEST